VPANSAVAMSCFVFPPKLDQFDYYQAAHFVIRGRVLKSVEEGKCPDERIPRISVLSQPFTQIPKTHYLMLLGII